MVPLQRCAAHQRGRLREQPDSTLESEVTVFVIFGYLADVRGFKFGFQFGVRAMHRDAGRRTLWSYTSLHLLGQLVRTGPATPCSAVTRSTSASMKNSGMVKRFFWVQSDGVLWSAKGPPPHLDSSAHKKPICCVNKDNVQADRLSIPTVHDWEDIDGKGFAFKVVFVDKTGAKSDAVLAAEDRRTKTKWTTFFDHCVFGSLDQYRETQNKQKDQPQRAATPPPHPGTTLTASSLPPPGKMVRQGSSASVRSNRSNRSNRCCPAADFVTKQTLRADSSAGFRTGTVFTTPLHTPPHARTSEFSTPRLGLTDSAGAIVPTVASEGTELMADNLSQCSFGSQIQTLVATSHPHLSHLVPLARGPTAYMDVLNKCNCPVLQDRMLAADEKEVLFSCQMKKKNKYGSSQRRDLIVTDGAMYISDKATIKHRIPLDQISGVMEDQHKTSTFAVLVPSFHDFLLTVHIDDQPGGERRRWAALINEERTLKMYAVSHLAVAHCTTLDNQPFVLRKVKDVKECIRRKASDNHSPLVLGKYDLMQLGNKQEVYNSLGGFGETCLKLSCPVRHVDKKAAEKDRLLLVTEYAAYIVSTKSPGHRKQRIDIRQVTAVHQASLLVLIKVPSGDTLCIFQDSQHIRFMLEALDEGRSQIFRMDPVPVVPCTEDDIRQQAQLAKVKKGNVQKLFGLRKSRLNRASLHGSGKGLNASSLNLGKGLAGGMKKGLAGGLGMMTKMPGGFGDVAKSLGAHGKANPVVFPAPVSSELLIELNRLASFPRDEKEISRMKSVKALMGPNGDTAVWLSADVGKMSLEKSGKEDPRTVVVADRSLYVMKGKKNEVKSFRIADISALVVATECGKGHSPCLVVFEVGQEHDLLPNLGGYGGSGDHATHLKDLLYAHLLKRKNVLAGCRTASDSPRPAGDAEARPSAEQEAGMVQLYSVATEEDLRAVARRSKGDPLPEVAMSRLSHDVLCCGATAACIAVLRRYGESSVAFSDVGCAKAFSKSNPGRVKYKKMLVLVAEFGVYLCSMSKGSFKVKRRVDLLTLRKVVVEDGDDECVVLTPTGQKTPEVLLRLGTTGEALHGYQGTPGPRDTMDPDSMHAFTHGSDLIPGSPITSATLWSPASNLDANSSGLSHGTPPGPSDRNSSSTPTLAMSLASPPGSPLARPRGDTTASAFSGVQAYPSSSTDRAAGHHHIHSATGNGLDRSVLGRPAARIAFLDSLKQVWSNLTSRELPLDTAVDIAEKHALSEPQGWKDSHKKFLDTEKANFRTFVCESLRECLGKASSLAPGGPGEIVGPPGCPASPPASPRGTSVGSDRAREAWRAELAAHQRRVLAVIASGAGGTADAPAYQLAISLTTAASALLDRLNNTDDVRKRLRGLSVSMDIETLSALVSAGQAIGMTASELGEAEGLLATARNKQHIKDELSHVIQEIAERNTKGAHGRHRRAALVGRKNSTPLRLNRMLIQLEALSKQDPGFVTDTLESLDARVARHRIEARLAVLERQQAEHGPEFAAGDALEWRLLHCTATNLHLKCSSEVPPAVHVALPEANLLAKDVPDQQSLLHEAQVLLGSQLSVSDLPRITDLRAQLGEASLGTSISPTLEETKCNLWLAEGRLGQLAANQSARESVALRDREAAEIAAKAAAGGRIQLEDFMTSLNQSKAQDQKAEQRRREAGMKARMKLQTQQRQQDILQLQQQCAKALACRDPERIHQFTGMLDRQIQQCASAGSDATQDRERLEEMKEQAEAHMRFILGTLFDVEEMDRAVASKDPARVSAFLVRNQQALELKAPFKRALLQRAVVRFQERVRNISAVRAAVNKAWSLNSLADMTAAIDEGVALGLEGEPVVEGARALMLDMTSSLSGTTPGGPFETSDGPSNIPVLPDGGDPVQGSPPRSRAGSAAGSICSGYGGEGSPAGTEYSVSTLWTRTPSFSASGQSAALECPTPAPPVEHLATLPQPAHRDIRGACENLQRLALWWHRQLALQAARAGSPGSAQPKPIKRVFADFSHLLGHFGNIFAQGLTPGKDKKNPRDCGLASVAADPACAETLLSKHYHSFLYRNAGQPPMEMTMVSELFLCYLLHEGTFSEALMDFVLYNDGAVISTLYLPDSWMTALATSLRDAVKGEMAERLAAQPCPEHQDVLGRATGGPTMQVRGQDVPVMWGHPFGLLIAMPRTLGWDVRNSRKSSVVKEEYQALRQAFQELIEHLQNLVEAGVPLEDCVDESKHQMIGVVIRDALGSALATCLASGFKSDTSILKRKRSLWDFVQAAGESKARSVRDLGGTQLAPSVETVNSMIEAMGIPKLKGLTKSLFSDKHFAANWYVPSQTLFMQEQFSGPVDDMLELLGQLPFQLKLDADLRR
eukprot:gene1529-441_t